MLHALEIIKAHSNNEVDFFTQDTDWWVNILRRLSELEVNTGIVTGAALLGFHAMTGSDTSHTTGKIHRIGKKSVLKVLMKAPSHVISALADLGKDEKPPANVISGCEEFCCLLVSTYNISARDPATLMEEIPQAF